MLINLDIHEMWYLLEASINGSHLRSDTIERFTNQLYSRLDEQERMSLFEWAVRLCYAWHKDKPYFEPCSNCCGHDTEFMKRYHPLNQYNVTTLYNGKTETHRAYRMNGEYYVTSSRRIASEYITSVEHIDLSKEWEEHKVYGIDYDKNILE